MVSVETPLLFKTGSLLCMYVPKTKINGNCTRYNDTRLSPISLDSSNMSVLSMLQG
jgi:hypothetical protein